jgi:5S rRNA maturation endonuclease (ribonuclease M5)
MMPERIRDWLNGRGIIDSVISDAGLDWDGDRLVIPLGNGFSKLRCDPDKDTLAKERKILKWVNPTGSSNYLYRRERIRSAKEVFIVEGELDALRLESVGLVAVSATCGTGSWDPTWCDLLKWKRVIIWLDSDEPGRKGTERLKKFLAGDDRIALYEIIHTDDCGKDATEILGRDLKWKDCLTIKRVSPARPKPKMVIESRDKPDIIAVLDSYGVQHGDVRREMNMLCPFHDDRNPSFSVNPEKGLWLCRSGCGSGDAYSFVMLKEGMDFKAAKEIVDKICPKP